MKILGICDLSCRLRLKKILISGMLAGVLSFVIGWFPSPSQANNENEKEGFIGITGLVINDTVSKVGTDFFDAFNSRWETVEGMDYTITITEKPDAVFGSQFWVKVDEDVVYSGRLNPRADFIEETARTAVQRVSLYLLERLTVSKELEKY